MKPEQNKSELPGEIDNPLLQANFDQRDQELQKPDGFRASFNRFEPINLSQAWSLWLTGCRKDDLFGLNPATGWLLTLILVVSLGLIALQMGIPGFP